MDKLRHRVLLNQIKMKILIEDRYVIGADNMVIISGVVL